MMKRPTTPWKTAAPTAGALFVALLSGAVAAGAGLSDSLVSNGGKASVIAHDSVQTRMSD